MIDRSYTLVTGPAGAGKTALIEAVGEATFVADAIVIEGNVAFQPRELDAAVFVAPAGGSLLVEERREAGRVDGRAALSLALGSSPATDVEDEELPYGLNVGDVVDEDDETVEVVESIPLSDEMARAIVKLLDKGAPSYQDKRWLRRDLEDLWKAHLVVVAAESPAAREEASRLRDEVLAVRRDEGLQREVTGRLRDWPRSCFVADVRDRKDEGTRKVVQAVKRRWR